MATDHHVNMTCAAVLVALGVWAGLCAASVRVAATGGSGGIAAFLGWQLAAAAVALILLILRRPLPDGPLRSAASVPAWLAGTLLAGLAALALYGWGVRMIASPG